MYPLPFPPTPTPFVPTADQLTAATEYIFSLPPWQGFLLALVLTLAATLAVGVGSLHIVKHALNRIETDIDDTIFNVLHTPTYLSIFLLGTYASAQVLTLSSGTYDLIRSVFLTCGLLLWGHAVWRVGQTLTDVDRETQYLDEAFLPIFNNLWKVGTVAGVGVGTLHIWGIDITPLLASAGIMGVAVGFAAKDTIANFFGGIALYFDSTYQKGDYIVLDSGQEGTVIDVGVRSTVLLTRDGIQITVPNSVLNSSLVINESAPRKHRRIRVPVTVAYGSNIDHVQDVLLDIAETEDRVRDQPSPRVRFQQMGDSALEFELHCWVDTPDVRISATDHLNQAIYKRFAEEDIKIPFPQRDIHVKTVRGPQEAAVRDDDASNGEH